MIFGCLLWMPRICVGKCLLLPLATTGTRLSAKSNKMLEIELELEDGGYWRWYWSRKMETELDVRHGSF